MALRFLRPDCECEMGSHTEFVLLLCPGSALCDDPIILARIHLGEAPPNAVQLTHMHISSTNDEITDLRSRSVHVLVHYKSNWFLKFYQTGVQNWEKFFDDLLPSFKHHQKPFWHKAPCLKESKLCH